MKSLSRPDQFVPFLAATIAGISLSGAATTLNNSSVWVAGGTLTDGRVIAHGQATFNGVKIGRGVGDNSTNVTLGPDTLVALNAGSNLTAIGAGALRNNTSGGNNAAVGYLALEANTTGINNTALGSVALRLNTSGQSNTAVGSHAMVLNTISSENSAFGTSALSNNTGNWNSAFGSLALSQNTTGYCNTALGTHAMSFNITGNNNVAVGMNAGAFVADGINWLTDAWNSVYIGSGARGKDNTDDNSIVIGTDAIGEGANTTVIGNSATTTTHLFGQTVSNSLSVTGATVLNGTVVLAAPQGDISMGAYGD